MPGELYHTNELLVLLGDNWFAKRSAKQAVELVQRRKLSQHLCYVVVVRSIHPLSFVSRGGGYSGLPGFVQEFLLEVELGGGGGGTS